MKDLEKKLAAIKKGEVAVVILQVIWLAFICFIGSFGNSWMIGAALCCIMMYLGDQERRLKAGLAAEVK